MKHKWDYQIPETLDEVIASLRRRIEVHVLWRDFCRGRSDEALASESVGVGTEKSHQRHINQYKAAIKIIEPTKG